uniref:Kinesin motor domain-containing protein n=1 Tax=Tetraselmis chuii TaxID=63592 RepID=A0A6U1FLY8_9CHLO
MNSESSRSHLIFTILLEHTNLTLGTRATSKLTFVDLAGSERVGRSGAINDKDRLDEARAINKSLSALGDVVAALTAGESFVPYRNHKLTQLMSDSLGGNAKTLMVVNVSPLASDAAETKNSLDYASRVKQVTNENSRSFETREIQKLKAEIAKLKAKK